jgi:hypothetical protein
LTRRITAFSMMHDVRPRNIGWSVRPPRVAGLGRSSADRPYWPYWARAYSARVRAAELRETAIFLALAPAPEKGVGVFF